MEMKQIAVPSTAQKPIAIFDRKGFSEAISRQIGPQDTLRSVAPKIGLSIATISRAMNEHQIGFDSVMKLCAWMDKEIDEFVVASAAD